MTDTKAFKHRQRRRAAKNRQAKANGQAYYEPAACGATPRKKTPVEAGVKSREETLRGASAHYPNAPPCARR